MRRIAFSKIRSVRLMPEALFIMGRYRPFVVVPVSAVSDDGATLMTYFERHLVAQGMLHRSSSCRTTITNTVYS